jgi:hypothetical protein
MTTNDHVEFIAKVMLATFDKQSYGIEDHLLLGLLPDDIRFSYDPRFLNAVLSHLVSIRAIDVLSHFRLNDANPHVMFIKGGVLSALSANDGDVWEKDEQEPVASKKVSQITSLRSQFKQSLSSTSPLNPVA